MQIVLEHKERLISESLTTDFTISAVDVIFKQRNGKLTATTLCLFSTCMNHTNNLMPSIHFSRKIQITSITIYSKF